MNNKKTELVFILDKSGSMGGLERDTIGGFNAMLEKQRAEDGICRITTVLFDNDYELLHDRLDLAGVAPLTAEEYRVGGSTALLDAIGKTIHKIGNAQKHSTAEHRADNVLFVIITDGEENSSRIYSSAQVKSMIARQTERYHWEFLFLGANIDAVETASHFGIAPDRAQNFHADSEGVACNFCAMSKTISQFRACAAVPTDWNAEIESDFAERKP